MPPEEKDLLTKRVNKALDTIRPHLKADGGDIELVGITKDNIVEVKWLGNCQLCDMSDYTMRAGVEEAIKTAIPEIRGIKALNGASSPHMQKGI